VSDNNLPPSCLGSSPERPDLLPEFIDLKPGEETQDYTIVKYLGQGGMGIVYEAVDNLNRTWALKFLSSTCEEKRVMDEAKILANLNNSNIVKIHQLGKHGSYPFISMEYLSGGNLAGRQKASEYVLRLMKPICEAVISAHRKGIIHRDIKPANILLDDKRNPKLADFGLAKRITDASGQVTGQSGSGTEGFRSPEQIAGKKLDCRTDVYSLGVTIYCLLTGDSGLFVKNLEKIPEEFRRIVGKCLEDNPGDRYQTVAALLSDLNRIHPDKDSKPRDRTGNSEPTNNTKKPEPQVKSKPAPVVNMTMGDVRLLKWILLLLLIVLVGSIMWPKLVRTLNTGKYKSVADLLRRVHFGTTAVGHNNRGVEYNLKKLNDKAIVEYNKAIELNSEFSVAYDNRGDAYYDLQKYDQAILDYTKAIELNPAFAVAFLNRASAYSALQQCDNAVSDYIKAVELDPKSASSDNNCVVAFNARGNDFLKGKNFSKAIEYFNTVVALNPKNAEAFNKRTRAYVSRGDAYSERKLYSKAIADYFKVIEFEPKNAGAYNKRGFAYSNSKKYEQAILDYDAAIKYDPQNAAIYHRRGFAYSALTPPQYDKAIADYNKAIKIDPKYSFAYHNRGDIYFKLQKYDRAMADYLKAIKYNPRLAHDFDSEFSQIYNIRGVDSLNHKQYDKAILDLDKAIGLNPKMAEAYSNRGFAYNSLGVYDRAIVEYSKAIELNPKLAVAYNNRGFVYLTKRESSRAVADWYKAINLNPEYKATLEPLIKQLKVVP